MTGKIFINYRRGDTAGFARALFSRNVTLLARMAAFFARRCIDFCATQWFQALRLSFLRFCDLADFEGHIEPDV
jgi:hypothetical protein